MPLVGGLGALKPTRNLGFQLTLFQPGGADYAHRITACPPGFENLAASLLSHFQNVQTKYPSHTG